MYMIKKNTMIQTYSTIKKRYYTRKRYDYNDDTKKYTEENHFKPLKSVDKVATYQCIQKRKPYNYQKEDAIFKSTDMSAADNMISEINFDSIIAKKQIKNKITQALTYLTPREERILRMRFGVGMNTDHTLREVSSKLFVNPERIRQIEAKALRKLSYYCKDFKELLEVA